MDLGKFRILPPAPHLCQICAVEHEAWQAHNRDSLFYNVSFEKEHGRSPTWSDAIARLDVLLEKEKEKDE